VEFHGYPIQHSVSEQETRDVHAFLLKVLAKG
jgi:hypothetical protein